MLNDDETFNLQTYNKTKIPSDKLCRRVMAYYCPDLTEVPQTKEQYKNGDMEFRNKNDKKIMVEVEIRDAEIQVEEEENWRKIINGEFATLDIPARKRDKETGYTYYVAGNINDEDDFAFVNIEDIRGVKIKQKMTKRGLGYFMLVPIDRVFFGRFDGNTVTPVSVSKKGTYTGECLFVSKEEPNLVR